MYEIHCTMKLLYRVLLVTCCLVVAAKCACKYNERHLYYKELQCKPVYTTDANCPSSYDCSNIKARQNNKCYYKNEEYNEGSSLNTSSSSDSPCIVECRCLSNYENKTTFTCISSECPELFEGPPAEGCIRQYSSLNECCSSKTYCPEEKAAVTKCTYKGEEYIEGQKIYPEDEPCKECICSAGFNGTLSEPWCKTISCGYDLHYGARIAEGCVPVLYKEKSCCPIDWKCPSDGEFRITPGTTTKEADLSGKIYFFLNYIYNK
uniref:VWFC domain-containing protein n=1 Tax=Clastoptera arizonana TaxID=38151 RepID=A0A1B6E6B8_9HEMI